MPKILWFTYARSFLHAAEHYRISISSASAIMFRSFSAPLFYGGISCTLGDQAVAIDEAISVFAAFGRLLEQNSQRRYHDNRIVEIYNGTVAAQPNKLVGISKKLNLDFLPAALFLEAERRILSQQYLRLFVLAEEEYVNFCHNLEVRFIGKWEENSHLGHRKEGWII